MQWPANVSETDFQVNLRVQPVDLPAFTQFCEKFSHECQGLLAVGPIIDLNFDDISLLKPIRFTLPILVQAKKTASPPKTVVFEANVPQQTTNSTSQPSQQEIIFQQQQSIFKSMLGEGKSRINYERFFIIRFLNRISFSLSSIDSGNERLILLYSNQNDNTWHIDTNVRLTDSKTRDIITLDMQYLYGRMIIARCDKQLISIKQLQTTISLLEEKLNQRSVSLILRHRLSNPNEVCVVCCSNQRTDTIDDELRQENYTNDDEQSKEVILQEGQLLELRFRGNVLPIDNQQQSLPFAFNTYFPFYFEANVSETDKYSQHFSPYFYGFVQIFSKQKVLRTITKELDKKKQQSEIVSIIVILINED
jgi:hypothetical protein